MGDVDNEIQLPQITLCNYMFSKENSFFENCRHKVFLMAIHKCLQNDTKFNLDYFMGSLETNV